MLVVGPGPAQQRPHAREQLLQRERLHHVVVGARVESVHAVGDRVARRQHQHRGSVVALAQHPADLEAVELRHQHVEHDRVRVLPRCRRQRLLAVAGQRNLIALQINRALERAAQLRLVVHDQDSHPPILVALAESGLNE